MHQVESVSQILDSLSLDALVFEAD